MNAVFLKRPDGTETEISICGQCGTPARGKTNFDISEKCCTCWECGSPLAAEERKRNTHYHDSCERKRRAIVEMNRMEKAVLVTDHDGPVYCEGVRGGSYGDGYFSDTDELVSSLSDEEIKDIDFAYCCTSSPVACLDLDDILESATEESFEDATDSLSGVEDLRAAVAVFNEANKGVLSWYVDYDRKVRLNGLSREMGK